MSHSTLLGRPSLAVRSTVNLVHVSTGADDDNDYDDVVEDGLKERKIDDVTDCTVDDEEDRGNKEN